MSVTALQPAFWEDHPAEAAYYAQIAVHRGWHAAAERAMGYLVNTGEPFSADDLRRLLADVEEKPTSPNAIGGLFMAWSRAGRIEQAGFMTSTQNKRRGGVNRVWRAASAST